jgi:hypothetical protein
LHLAFESKSLRDLCEKEAEAARVLGEEVATVLKHRLADLCAAATSSDLGTGRPRLEPDGSALLVDLTGGYVLVCKPNHVVRLRESAGAPDWTRVSRVKIVDVRHGDEEERISA